MSQMVRRSKGDDRVGFRDAFAVGEFRAIWAAQTLSSTGDQLSRVALAILVYERTSSTLLTALTYALTFIPSIFGGALLSGLADRYPRRSVMFLSDVARAILVAAMVIPGIPLAAVCALVILVVLLGAPFKAAQAAVLPDLLPGDTYEVGLAIRNITDQTVQLVAFAGGGLLIAIITPRGGLAVDAVTFVLSALFVRFGLRHRPPPAPADDGPGSGKTLPMLRGGLKVIWEDPALRSLTAMVFLLGLYIAPEGLAAPYADSLGQGSGATGLLMAADPVGSIIGAYLFTRFVPASIKPRLIGPLTILAGVPLLFCALEPNLVVSMLMWCFSGALATAYLIQANASFTRRVPDSRRGQASGLIASGLVASQGVGVLLAGIAAEYTTTFLAVAMAGALGILLALRPAVTWRRSAAVATA